MNLNIVNLFNKFNQYLSSYLHHGSFNNIDEDTIKIIKTIIHHLATNLGENIWNDYEKFV